MYTYQSYNLIGTKKIHILVNIKVCYQHYLYSPILVLKGVYFNMKFYFSFNTEHFVYCVHLTVFVYCLLLIRLSIVPVLLLCWYVYRGN